MPLDAALVDKLMTKKNLKFDFRAISDEDADNLIFNVEAVAGKDAADGLRGAWTRARTGGVGIAGTLDLTAFERNDPRPFRTLTGAMEATGRGVKKAWQVGSGPLPVVGAPAQQAIDTGLEGIRALVGKTLGVPTSTPPARAGFTTTVFPPALAPTSPMSLAMPVPSALAGDQGNVQRVVGAAAMAPFEMGGQYLKDQFTTPFGLATLPLPRAIPSAFTQVAKMMGRGLSPAAQVGLDATLNAAAKAAGPARADFAAKLWSRFVRPDAYVATRGEFMRNTTMEINRQREFMQNVALGTTAEEQRVIARTMDEVSHARVEILGTLAELEAKPTEEALFNRLFDVPLDPKLTRAYAEKLDADRNLVVNSIAKERAMFGPLLPSDHQQIAEEIWSRRQAMAQRQVASGLHPEETFKLYEGVALPELYTSRELAVTPALERLHVRAMRPERERLKTRGMGTGIAEESLAEKRAHGLSENLLLRAGKGLAQDTYQANYGEFLAAIASDPSLSSTVKAAPGWEQVMGAQRWGALDKLYLHPGVKQDLESMYQTKNSLGQLIDGIAKYFKWAVTVLNPPVHAGNILGNAFLADAAGAFDHGMGTTIKGIRSFAAQDATYRKIAATGLLGEAEFEADGMQQFLRMAHESFLGHETQQAAAYDLFMRTITEGPRHARLKNLTPGALYNLEEQFAKYLVAHATLTHGAERFGIQAGDLLASARHAEQWLFNYSDVPVGVRQVSSGGLGLIGAPFLTFQTKATPRMLDVMINQPHKFVKWHAMYQGLNRANMNAVGLSDADFAEYRRLRAENNNWPFLRAMTELAPTLVLPVRGPQGQVYAMDMSRFTFFGQVFQPRGLPFFGAGPAYGALTALTMGKTSEGRTLFNPDAQDVPGEAPLTPSIRTRRLVAAGNAIAVPPPFLRRTLIGALSAMHPSFTPEGPKNAPARLLELLGSQGARDPSGTLQGPVRQTMAALIGSPEAVDLPFLRMMSGLRTKKGVEGYRGQRLMDAIKRGRAQ